MGKWSHLKGKLEPLPLPQSDWTTRLLAMTDALVKTSNLGELAADYEITDAEIKLLEKTVKERRLALDATSRAMLQLMEKQNLDSVTLGGYKWTPSPEPYPQVVDRVALRTWAEENEMEDILASPHQTLKALVKISLDPKNDEPMPAGIDLFLKTGFRRTKAK